MAGTSSMAEFDKRIAGYQQYQQWRSQHTTIDQQSGREIVARGNPYQEYAKWGNFRVDGDRYNQLVQLVLQREQQMQQAYSMQGQTYRAINRAEGFNVRQLLGGTGGTGGGGGTPVPVEIKKFDPSAAAAAAERGVDTMPSVWAMMNLQSRNPYDLGKDISTQWQLNKKGQLVQKGNKEQGEYKSFSNEMANITQGVSGIVSGIEQLGIDIPEGLKSVLGGIQAVAGILTGISALVTIITAIQGTKSVPVIGWMLSHGGVVPHAANGYYVPGTRRSTDTTPILANAGELVLNESSQDNLALGIRSAESLLNTIDRYQESIMRGSQYNYVTPTIGGGMLGNMKMEAMITGEQIRLVLNNNGRRTGRGEYVTTNFR